MKLYSFQPSPYGARVRLALRRKNLAFEVAPPSDVDSAQATFRAPSPMEVPTLVADDGTVISGSGPILEYLEDSFPEHPLLPNDPSARARARMLVQTPDTYMQNAPRKLFGMADPTQRNGSAIEEAFGMIATAFNFINMRISDGPWAIGGSASLADCALVPMLNAVALLGTLHDRRDVITRHDKLASYWQAAQREPLNATLIAEQIAGLPVALQGFARIETEVTA